MTKRLRLRELRASLLKTQAWSIHEPTLHALLELASGESSLSAKQINGRLGLAGTGLAGRGLGVRAGDESAPAGSPFLLVGGLAVLPIFGVLQQRSSWLTKYLGWTATEQLERDFQAALASEQVTAIVLYCDSPGGVAVGIDEVSSTIFAGRNIKPVQAFVRGYCASACYYLASAASKITATPSSTIGSVGTIYTHFEYAQAFQKMGIGVTVIKHGARKGDGNPYEALSEPAKASLQRWVDAYGDQFDSAVARNRGITVADVKQQFGQGEAFLADEARGRGLIDAVGTWEQLKKEEGGRMKAEGGKTFSALIPQPSSFSLPPSSFSLDTAGLEACPTDAASSFIPQPSSFIPQPSSFIPPPSSFILPQPGVSNVKVSLKVRAALFARGLITAQDCDDSVCLAAIGAYFAARGEACPVVTGRTNDGNSDQTGLDDEKVVAALFAISPAGQAASGTSHQPPAASTAPAGTAPAANVQAAHERELQEARQAAAADERKRTSAIKASGQLLGLADTEIQAAIDGGQPHAQIVAAWHEQLAGKEKPLASGAVKVGQEGIERYVADAAVATLLHFGQPVPQGTQVTPAIQQLSQAPLVVHAEQCLKAAGIRYDAYDREDIAAKALAMDGYERQLIRAESGAFNRPGNFPNLLSALANKIFDEGVEAAETTYQDYAGVWPGDLPDFKPAPVVARGGYGSLDEVLDAEEFKQQGLAEECLSYMVLSRFGNSAALTPVLVANDDLGAFMDELGGLSEGWELTKNRGCLNLITGNVALLDTYSLYDDTNHGNDLTGSGSGVPSVTSWDAMQQKMAAQTTVGGVAKQRTRLAVVLVPPKHEVAAQQTFLPLGGTVVVENKTATADTSLNVFRGKVKVAMEPELAASSADVWYGFADPKRFRNATVVVAYFRGWGKTGKRERWYDPKTKCWYVSLEGRAGFAAKNYRTTIRNDGVA